MASKNKVDMESCFVGGGSGGDQTTSGGDGGLSLWFDLPSIQRRRLSSPSPSAFLAPAFNACAGSGSGSGDSFDGDPSLLRYRRPLGLFLPSSSSSPADSSDPAAARRNLQRLLQLRSSLSSLSSSSSCSTPLSPIENLHRATAAHRRPMKVEVEEDVLVMDGVLVSDSSPNRSRPGSDPDFCSGGTLPAAIGLYKTELCRSWEETGSCRYGFKCQFAHGKEELRGIRPMKQRSEVDRQSVRSIPGASSNMQGPRFHFIPPPAPVAARPSDATKWTLECPPAKDNAMPGKSESSAKIPISGSSTETTFTWPPSEEEDSYINNVLYGPSNRRRLPVFVDICP